MRSMIAWFLVILGSTMVIAADGSPATGMMGENDMPLMTSSVEAEGKPSRPRLFQSPEQIRSYLDTLGKYYTFHNRNRFGKRSGNPWPLYRDSMVDNKGYQEYDIRAAS